MGSQKSFLISNNNNNSNNPASLKYRKNSLQKVQTIDAVTITQYNQDQSLHLRDQHIIFLQQFRSIDQIFQIDQNQHFLNNFKQLGESEHCCKIIKYFKNATDLQAYISNLIKIRKIIDVEMYDDLTYHSSFDQPFYTTVSFKVRQYVLLSKSDPCKYDLEKKMNILIFVANLLRRIKNIYFTPQNLILSPQGIYLISFQVSDISPSQLFIGFIRWCFDDKQKYQTLNFRQQYCSKDALKPLGIPIYLQQIYNNLSNKKQQISSIIAQNQLQQIKNKSLFLMGKIDSFYACSYFKKASKYITQKQWIFLKNKHEIYFYNISDGHTCQGKVIRKKRKINLNNLNLLFDCQDLQIVYIPQNSKLVVSANQFDLQNYSSTSDIQIKYKLPVKFKNPLLSQSDAKNGQIWILQGMLYKYLPSTNKLIQITKRISDYIFLTTTKDSQYLIIKLSIDIFKNGIRVYYKDQQMIASLTGDRQNTVEISSIRVDIKSVNFCVQVYKGVFFLMASRNFWVLDMNFQCFFSFATPSQLKKLTNPPKVINSNDQMNNNEMLFNIIDQPFAIDFTEFTDQNNVVVTDTHFHVLGKIQGKPYYLKYKFIHRIGALQLQGYQPLFIYSTYKQLSIAKNKVQYQPYHFNFHQQSLHLYKYGNWIFRGQYFLQVYDFTIKWQKTNYEVLLQTQTTNQTLKQYMQVLNKNKTLVTRKQIILILYKIYKIYQYLLDNSITHRNLSINNLIFTKKQEFKVHGWCQPPRNWHISDYKDYLLTCFNVITLQSCEKLTQKILATYKLQLQQYPIIHQKLLTASKQSKTIEKKIQIQRTMQQFKQYLEKQICVNIHNVNSNQYIFSFQYNTPRFSMLDLSTNKIKKLIITQSEDNTTIEEQFTFTETDKYQWNQLNRKLFIFTASYQFLQATISVQSISTQQSIILEDYQYLPNNISECAFICVKGRLFGIGGLKKSSNSKSVYNMDIYQFNWNLLRWEIVGQLLEPRVNPKLVVAEDGKQIYVIGGLVDHQFEYFKIISFNLQKTIPNNSTINNNNNKQCTLLIDKSISNPLKYLSYNAYNTLKIFHLNKQLHIFMFWYLDQGSYVIQYFSCLSAGFNVRLSTKNYIPDSNISSVSVAIDDNLIHVLRVYGKYTKILINQLAGANVKNQTIYAI